MVISLYTGFNTVLKSPSESRDFKIHHYKLIFKNYLDMSIHRIRQFCSALTDQCAGEQTAKLGLEAVRAHTEDAHTERTHP